METNFLWNASFRRVEIHFLLSVLIEQPLSYYWKPIFTCFLDIPAGESRWKGIFLASPSFWLVDSEFMCTGSSIILFTAFFLLMETIISSKLSFLWVEIRISLNNNFPLDGKKLAAFREKRNLAGKFSTIFFPFPLLSEKNGRKWYSHYIT